MAYEYSFGRDAPKFTAHKPITVDGKRNLPRALHNFSGAELTHQFYAINGSDIGMMFNCIGNRNELAK